MTTQIDYRIQTSSLPWGGTFNTPLGIGHPNMQVYKDNRPVGGIVSGDEAVIVPTGEQIIITCTDAAGRRNVQIAPVWLLAGTWTSGGATATCTTAMMSGATTKPIDTPQFDVNLSSIYSLSYNSTTSGGWQNDASVFSTFMGSSIMIGNDVSSTAGNKIGPFISFNTQSLTGSLWYGLGFAVLMDNVSRGYFWFDPTITVQGS